MSLDLSNMSCSAQTTDENTTYRMTKTSEQHGLLTMHLWWAATFWLSDTSSWPQSLSRLVLQKAHLRKRAPAPFLCPDMTKGFSGCLEIDSKIQNHHNCAGTPKRKYKKTLQYWYILFI